MPKSPDATPMDFRIFCILKDRLQKVKHIYFELFEAGVGENEAINPTHLQDV
jgi:hypothetical protein